jgi:hypothetical protein
LLVEGLPERFPAPRTLKRRRGRIALVLAVVAVLVTVGIVAGVLLAGGGGSSDHGAAPPTNPRRPHSPASRLAALLGSSTAQRVHAVMSPYDYFPVGVIPAGTILDGQAKLDEHPSSLPLVCGPVFTANFAAPGGKRLAWSTSRDCSSGGVTACHEDGYPGYGFGMAADRQAVINGRRVFYSTGNHGSNAWACIPLRVNGFADVAVVGMWESNFLTPRRAMILVAHARPLSA